VQSDPGAPLVTVMIPTYGQAPVLARAVGSALRQDLESLEVIVADDASPDDTAEVVARFDDPRLRYHRNPTNLGRVGNYRHTLERLARGKYVLNLDGDDWLVDPTYLRRAAQLLEEEPDVVMVFANAWRYRQEDGAFFRLSGQNEGLPRVVSGTDIFLRYPTGEVWIPHLTALYRRDVALEVGFYREDIIGSDTESLLRLVLGRKVGFIDTHAAAWRIHGANATNSIDVEARVANLACVDGPFEAARASGAVATPLLERWRAAMYSRLGLEFVRGAVRGGDLGAAWRFMAQLARKSPRSALRVAGAAVAFALRRGERRRFLPVYTELGEEALA